jgi:amino acid adenylation domain-containing protein
MHGSTDYVEGYRLSPQQRRLWPVARRRETANALFAVAVEGRLDAGLLRQALLGAVAAHDALRLVYLERPETAGVVQAVCEPALLDWSQMAPGVPFASEAAREAFVDEVCRRERARPFDLGAMPQLRATLLEFEATRHVLVLTTPVLTADTRSFDNLLAWLCSAYDLLLSGGAAQEPPMQYLQYAEWQNELLAGEEGTRDGEFWRDATAALPGASGVPFERRRPAGDVPSGTGFAAASLRAELPAELCALLASVSGAHGFAPRDLLLAAWHGLMHRLTRTTPTFIGVVRDGREYEVLAPVVGLMWNWLPSRADFGDATTILQTASELKRQRAEAEAHACWFGETSGRGAADAGVLRSVGFGCERVGERTSSGLRFKPLRRQAVVEPFGLMLYCTERGERVELDFQFDAARLDRADVERIAESYRLLLGRALDNPRERVGRLPLVGEAEARRIISAGDGGALRVGDELRVEQLFEAQARRAPGAPAVVFEGEQLTYGELDAAAQALADRLVAHGAGSEVTVGLCVRRSLDLVIAIIGILKSGAAYVPIEPALPDSRAAFMLTDSRASILVTEGSLRERFAGFSGPALTVDDVRATGGAPPRRRPDPAAGLGLAYLIYTSGSTGTPKGVAVEHRQLIHYVNALTACHPSLAGCSFASVSTVAADLGNTAIYTALLTGGCLHLISQECATDPQQFARYLASHEVDALKIVPSHLRALLSEARTEAVLPRRCVVFGGETLASDLVALIAAAGPEGLTVLNHYGPTESTVGATTFLASAAESDETRVPIGRPLPGTSAYLLDKHLQVVPRGVAGEVFIGGGGVSRGYYGRPGLTAERFVPDPFAHEPGRRLYRTGDTARLRADGCLVFEGRSDDQVKVNGFRVELGEVEAAMKSHPSVRDAVALARDEGGATTLSGYVVPQRGASRVAEAVQAFLFERLPAYMVPPTVLELEALPLSPNGKVDRAALRAADARPRRLPPVEPRTELERQVHAVWVEVLQNNSFGVEDSFFEVGGSSLKAIQLLSRLRRAFGVELPLPVIFDKTTVAALAAHIEEGGGRPDGDPELERQMREVEQLSDEQVRRLLLEYERGEQETPPGV